MSPEVLLTLLEATAPAIRDVVVTLIKAIESKDEIAVRQATEAALRLAFEVRQGLP